MFRKQSHIDHEETSWVRVKGDEYCESSDNIRSTMVRAAASVGWPKRSQKRYLVLSEHKFDTGKQGESAFKSPLPQHADVTSAKPEIRKQQCVFSFVSDFVC